MITAQEILVDNASYPTPAIDRNSHDYRPLGLGYANLGVLLMDRGPALRLRRRAGLRGGGHRADARRGLRPVGPDRLRRWVPSPATRRTPSRCCGSSTSTGKQSHMIDSAAVPRELLRGGPRRLGRGLRPRRAARLPQQPGHGAGAHRDHRLHDGLRHHRHRARHRAGQVQEARGRRDDQDRQPVGAAGPEASWATTQAQVEEILALHRREGDDRGRAAPQGRAPADLRLRLPARATASGPSTTWAT